MFGYVQYDIPNLFVKDLMLYKALYCGLCKGIGKTCGQAARIGLSYDVTFLSALLHNIAGVDVVIEKQNCFEHAIRKRPIAAADELTLELGALNTVLIYYKLTDDVLDGERGRGKRLFFKRGFKRAGKKYPALVALVKRYMEEQARTEKKAPASPDEAAEPSACMMRDLSRHFLREKAGEGSDELFYAVGKWVYLVDALDDYDKDRKKGGYNPFVKSYASESREKLVEEHEADLAFLFDTLFYSMREGLADISFRYNRDLTDNVVLRGIPLMTQRVMRGEKPDKMTVRV